jgi:hypothetical protein
MSVGTKACLILHTVTVLLGVLSVWWHHSVRGRQLPWLSLRCLDKSAGTGQRMWEGTRYHWTRSIHSFTTKCSVINSSIYVLLFLPHFCQNLYLYPSNGLNIEGTLSFYVKMETCVLCWFHHAVNAIEREFSKQNWPFWSRFIWFLLTPAKETSIAIYQHLKIIFRFSSAICFSSSKTHYSTALL